MKSKSTLKRKSYLIFIAIILVTLLCGCSITSGVFVGMSKQSTNTSFKASYIKFNGSITRKINLKEGDQVAFSYKSGDNLRAVVRKGDEDVLEITDESVFTATEDGMYNIVIEGESENSNFDLNWEIEE